MNTKTNPRKCPVCHTLLKSVPVSTETEIDMCAKCRGVWLDPNELESANRNTNVSLVLDALPHTVADPIYCQFCGKLNSRSFGKCVQCSRPFQFRCPSCRNELHEVVVAEVHADRCGNCHGVWLDGGEMNVLFENYKKLKMEQAAKADNPTASDVAAAVTLDALFWAPELIFYSAGALGHLASHIPGAIDSALDHAGNIPDVAAGMAEGAVEVAGKVVDVSGQMLGGALEAAGNVPEMAGSAMEAAGSLIEQLFALIGELFD